jgi:hypothetical protein
VSAVAVQESVFYATGTGRKPSANLKLIHTPQVARMNSLGQTAGVAQEEVAADFAPNGLFSTSDPKLIAWLREHPDNGIQFLEKGNEPGRLLPSEEEFRAQVVDAATQADVGGLRQLVDEERGSHGRGELIALAEHALERLGAELHDVASGDPGGA